jgi:hypothetical protein|tara:strand:- start:57 stop:785 length:729 start_codon:yes stop_codon:yes gene_type:complete
MSIIRATVLVIYFIIVYNIEVQPTTDRTVHHSFNAHLLRPLEYKLSIFGQINLGISENLEVGTQGFAWLLSSPNFSIKHRLFQYDAHQLAVSINCLFAEKSLFEYIHLDVAKGVVIPLSIIDTVQWKSNFFVNIGIYDFLSFFTFEGVETSSEVHLISPSIGFDWIVSSHIDINLNAYYPSYFLSYYQDSTGSVQKNKVYLDRGVLFSSITYHYGKAYFELGYIFMSRFLGSVPFVNIYWRV